MAKTAEESFEELLKLIPIDFVLPSRVREDLQRKGIGATIHDDIRESPRFRTNGPAILTWESSPAGIHIPRVAQQVIVRDLSKSGVGILTSCQWFPEEIGKLQFAIGDMVVKVMRVRRLGPRCFEVGGRILRYTRYDSQ